MPYCPICLSLAGGLLGPSAGPLLPLPSLAGAAAPLFATAEAPRERPALPFSARAPPPVV